MKFYSFHNPMGFANSGYVYVWSSRKARDDYGNGENILRKNVTYYARRYSLKQNRMIEPRPFSGEYWGIDNSQDFCSSPYDEAPAGWLGVISVCDPYVGRPQHERFYK